MAETVFARYGQLENYRRLFAREGITSVGELVVVGDEDAVAERLRTFADADATELWAVTFGGDADVRRTRATLARLGEA